uniref:F-box domain-containing protein n=1 Tax=Kwoniella pini CBS 10737 TaxID=1296096 RepID=A0A1B9I356_9TREE|nr:uncharacterized protein I206_04475 [Kwoniella pini CBS 10737]OCF49944.1 hypothetical protein I206_04475 [Kwoniella pini CBS 10737]
MLIQDTINYKIQKSPPINKIENNKNNQEHPIEKFDSHLIEDILINLSIKDLISCSEINKFFHNNIREIPSIQFKLYKKLYKVFDFDNDYNNNNENFDFNFKINSTKNIINLIEINRNLIRLTPRILKLNFKLNLNLNLNSKEKELIFKIQENYLITIPKYIKKDLIIIIDIQGIIHSISFNQFYKNDIILENFSQGIEIPFEIWEKRIENEIRINLVKNSLDKEILIVELSKGKWLIYDWKTTELLHEFPPDPKITWGSLYGSIINHQGLLIGLDIPSLPWMPNSKPKDACLAVFNLCCKPVCPIFENHPMVFLEIPIKNIQLSILFKILNQIPKNKKIIVHSEGLPILHETFNPFLIRITIPFKIIIGPNQGSISELNIVIPIKQLESIKMDNLQKVWHKGRTWRRSSNPLDGVNSIPFEKYYQRCHFWIDDYNKIEKNSINSIDYQVGQKIIKIDKDLMKKTGKLKLEISDFNHLKITNHVNLYGALRGLELDKIPEDGNRPAKPRSVPQSYKLSETAATTHLSARFKCSGILPLGMPGEIEKVVCDEKGQKLIIQQVK